MITNTTNWDIAAWVHDADHIRKGIIIDWQGHTHGHMPVVHDLDDMTEGELVLINSTTGEALWEQQSAPSLEDMVEVIKESTEGGV